MLPKIFFFKSFNLVRESTSIDIFFASLLLTLIEKVLKYLLRDIFNIDNRNLYFLMAYDYTIAWKQIKEIKINKACHIIKLTMYTTVSKKLEFLIIDNAMKPHYFIKKLNKDMKFYY